MPYLDLPGTADQPPLCVHYQHYGDSANGVPLLLLHELGGSLETWHAFASHVSPHFDVYAFDQRSAGASEKTATDFSLWDLAADTVHFADTVGISGHFAVMGLAMGAITALHIAVRYPEHVRALVLCDGTAAIDARSSSYLVDQAAKIRTEGMRVVADRTLKNAFRGIPDPESRPEWRDYKGRFVCNAPVPYAMQSEALARFRLDDDDFAKVAIPTLVLTGQHDCIWPPGAGAALAARIRGARFEVVEDAAHFPPLQEPLAVADTVAEFLKSEVILWTRSR